MAQYDRVKLSIILFNVDDVISTSLGDNEVPELGGDNEGGIFG